MAKQILMVDGSKKIEIDALHVDSDPNIPQIAEIDGKFYYLSGKEVTDPEHLRRVQSKNVEAKAQESPVLIGVKCPECGAIYPNKKSLQGHKMSHFRKVRPKAADLAPA